MRHEKSAVRKSTSQRFFYFKTQDFHDSVRTLVLGIVAGVSLLVLYQNIQENHKNEANQDSVITESNSGEQNLKSLSEKNQHLSEFPHLFSLPILPNYSMDQTRNIQESTQDPVRLHPDQFAEETGGAMDVQIRKKPEVIDRHANTKDFSSTSQKAKGSAPKQPSVSTPLQEVEPLRLEPASAVTPY